MNIFIFRMGDNWNRDYVSAHKTAEGVAKEICELCEEEGIYPDVKELAESISSRRGYVELLDCEKFDIPEYWGYSVAEAVLEK